MASATPDLLERSHDETVFLLWRHGYLHQYPRAAVALTKATAEEIADATLAYARQHGLEATDERAILTSLVRPRPCAHPDTLSITDDARWPQPTLSWTVVGGAAFPGLPMPDVLKCFDWVFATWASVCGIQPQYVTDPNQANILIETGPIDGPGGILAYSELADGTMNPKRQRFDAAEQGWVLQHGGLTPGGLYDLYRTACHEMGHVLGIGHLEAGCLMAPIYDLAIDGPRPGDVAEAQKRYGPPLSPPPPPPPQPAAAFTIQLAGRIDTIQIPGYRITKLAS